MLRTNLQLTKQMGILIYLPVPIRKNEGTPPRKPYSLLRLFATLFTGIGRIKSNGAKKTYVLRSDIRRNQEHRYNRCMHGDNKSSRFFVSE